MLCTNCPSILPPGTIVFFCSWPFSLSMTARLRSRSRGSWHNSEGSWGLDGRWKLHLHCGRSEGFHDTVSDNSVIVVQRNSSHELQVRIKEPQRNSQWRVHNAVVNSKDSFEVRFSNGPHSFFECRHRSTMIEYHFFNIGKPPAAMVWVRVPHDYEVVPFLQIFADQLSQTAASLPGANVKHPSSAAVWAYAHLDIAFCTSKRCSRVGFGTFCDFRRL